ncbi:hypothetical protein [Kitasatospora purpeofusca]|uniref:hypothetical protein n=1 Tax=Kitasatospora purpeofusca TaxID=67352 RepID=UPI0036D2435B
MRMYSARPGGRRYHPVLDRARSSTSGALALLAGGVLALALGGLGELHAGWFRYAAFAGLAALLGASSRPTAAPVIGLAAWLCCNAFAEHRHGELGWAGAAPEFGHYLLFTAAALAPALVAALPRRVVRVEALAAPVRRTFAR